MDLSQFLPRELLMRKSSLLCAAFKTPCGPREICFDWELWMLPNSVSTETIILKYLGHIQRRERVGKTRLLYEKYVILEKEKQARNTTFRIDYQS